jgi:hypothetical protein
MLKQDLKNLTINKLNEMSEVELDQIAQEVVNKLNDQEIKALPEDVKDKLKIKKNSPGKSLSFWITIIGGALAMSLVQLAQGK